MENKNRLFNNIRQKQKQRVLITVIATVLGFTTIIFLIFFFSGNLATSQKAKAAPGLHGDKTVTGGGSFILNEYTDLTANATMGTTQITVTSNSLNTNSRFAGNLASGELIMIIQMQGAAISETNSSSYGSISSYNNCGKFEFAEVSGVTGTTKIDLVSGLLKDYTSLGNVQVVRVPRYQNFTVDNGNTVTCPAWNGTIGGILAIEVNNIATINGIIDVSGKGFRGGTIEQNASLPGDHINWRSTNANDGAEKGESIVGYQSDYTLGRYGRGAPANGGGGGNSHNSAGGGGANGNNGVTWNGKGNPDNSVGTYTTAWNKESASFSANTSSGGGRGGYSYSALAASPTSKGPGDITWFGDFRYNVGGYGGHPLDYSSGKIFMGGGGGAGDSNGSKGTAGGSGGGLVYLLCAANVTGSGSITANGNDAAGVTANSGFLDAPGGAGGGGTIIVYSRTGSVSSLALTANGGKGGDLTNNFSTNEAMGAGAGGGGGYISVTSPSGLTQSVAGGNQGSNNNSIMSTFKPNGATRGAAGQIATNPPNPYTGVVALPIQLTSFTGNVAVNQVNLHWVTQTEQNNQYFTVERSSNGASYSLIGKVDGSGTTVERKEYSFIDKTPAEKINYYRLSQFDFNGNNKSFPPIAVEIKRLSASSTSDPLIFPNPFQDKFSLRINSKADKSNAQVKISNLTGKIVHTQQVVLSKGTNIIEFNTLAQLPPGVYTLTVKPENEASFTTKVIKN